MKTLYESLKDELITENDLSDTQREEYKNFLEELNKSFDEEGVQGCNAFLEKCRDENLYEGVFGGIVGFLAGPSVGKIVARALGMDHGILYDLLTSRLVSAAIGNAIQKELGKK